ncbi:feruloyl-CoA synthase [Eoetvoesiella caeni]
MATTSSDAANFRPIALGPYEGMLERRPDGTMILRSTDKLAPSPARYTEPLVRWAAKKPQAPMIAQRGENGAWKYLSYGAALEQIQHLGQALLDRGLSAERPLMVLSENSIEHALMALAAMHVGIPYAPISPAYSLLSQSAERVRHAVELLTPGAVFAFDAARFSNAIKQSVPAQTELIFVQGSIEGRLNTLFGDLLKTATTTQVDQAHASVGIDTVAKFLFTSGSTKLPKAVVNTHGMMMSNQQMYLQCYPFLAEEPPVLVDWMPWHHTAAGNNNFGVILYHGGTLYIDEGKPTQDGMAETLRNLREVSSTIYYSVPKGLETLVHEMKRDTALRDRFFSRMRLIFPCGAALPGPLKQSMDELAIASCGARIPMTMGLGMTETAPFAISAHLPDWQAGVIGIPAPGVEVKLVPNGDKIEVRYRGPNITPGYWRQPELTQASFDEEGFFCSGDAARFIDDNAPERGLLFDGRIAEDFKLISGTWVNVGALRLNAIAAGTPYIHDVVITGHDRGELGMLILLLPTASALAPELAADASLADIAGNAKVRAWAQALLDKLANAATGSSNRIVRALIIAQPALMETGEMTDKGSINQRTMLKTRAALVEQLYTDQPGHEVLTAHTKAQAT